MREHEAATYTYRVSINQEGFLAYCRDLDIRCVGHTMAAAIDALRTAIDVRRHRVSVIAIATILGAPAIASVLGATSQVAREVL